MRLKRNVVRPFAEDAEDADDFLYYGSHARVMRQNKDLPSILRILRVLFIRPPGGYPARP